MLVAFAGPDGAGKTTQVKRVCRWLQQAGWQPEIIDRWDILDAEKFPECRFIDSTRQEMPICISEMEGLSRSMFMFWSVILTMRKMDLADPSRIYLVDGYWMKHGAAEIEYGCDPLWVEATVRCLPPADLTFYLDIEPEEALHRKPDITAYECGRTAEITAENFISHQSKLRRRLLDWAEENDWDFISSMEDPALVTEQICKRLAQRLTKSPECRANLLEAITAESY
jgi:thymidylate kinase